MNKPENYISVWAAITDSPIEAANMRAKSELMQKIVVFIKQSKFTQVKLAERCSITQPRLNDLLRGRISKFSLDALVNIAASLGLKIHIQVEAA